MCTAISFLSGDHYFGRNLDLEFCYHEQVTITPRNYPLHFHNGQQSTNHPAIIGIATVAEGYPLYYDATNESGLSVAGLNFPGNAVYSSSDIRKNTIAPFELIPWVLSQCHTADKAVELLQQTQIGKIQFSPKYPLTDLHWIVSDASKSFTVEPLDSGLEIYQNPVGVLTNNPPFPYHMENLKNFMHLSTQNPENTLSPQLELKPYSRGMGALGLPGDLSSASRFIRASFTKLNIIKPTHQDEAITQFFHILDTVSQQEGCVKVGKHYEKTIYSSCCNTSKGIYYYSTYENRQVTGIDLHRTNLNANKLTTYPLLRSAQIRIEN